MPSNGIAMLLVGSIDAGLSRTASATMCRIPKTGIIIPKVGISDALFTRTQQRVLGLVFGQPDRDYGMVELIDLAGAGRGAVQRELERLVSSGLVSAKRVGTQRRYSANHASPIFAELRSIIDKTAGVAAILQAAFAPVAASIQLAVLYGSIAKETAGAGSDVDVLVVSDTLALEDVFAALEPAEKRLGRTVSPTLYTAQEFRKRRRTPFLSKVLSGKHVVLIGSEDAVATPR